MMVNVYNAWEVFSAMTTKPEITLRVNGKSIVFLCDTGACKTVLRNKVPRLAASNSVIWVKSANGAISMNRVSKPLYIQDYESGRTIKAPVVISPECPINLLGRDLMQLLQIGVVPTTDGMRVVRLDDDSGELYHVSGGTNRVYYSLDLIRDSFTGTTSKLLHIAESSLTEPHDIMTSDKLHVTLNVASHPD